jgi:hypothetical protein
MLGFARRDARRPRRPIMRTSPAFRAFLSLVALVALVPIAAIACSSGSTNGGGGTDLCAGVSCSGHGTCSSASGVATCSCDTGYTASGTSCVAQSGPCAGITCSGHGSCSDASGSAVCTCDTGYVASGTTCVADAGPCKGVDCSGHGSCSVIGGAASCTCDPGYVSSGATTCVASTVPTLGGCTLFPANNIFNTPIDKLPVHANSAAFINTIGGTRHIHLDLGTTVDQTSDQYYGIPYNVVHGNSLTWTKVRYYSPDPEMNWDPTAEADCASGAAHTLVSPCTAAAASSPLIPIPTSPLVEGGIITDPTQPYGDHHILIVDADTCTLWETYHSYKTASGWDIFGSARFDLKSNAMRPKDWTSADAAGFPMLPLILKESEASSGTIRHALRFTILSSKIREAYVWPARHLTSNKNSTNDLPPMGQLFRLKASYAIPSSANTQSKAILTALKTYGMYLADGGSDMYVTGDPSAAWADPTFSTVQSVPASEFEAVDLASIQARAGFDSNSAAVPPP